MIDGFLTCLKQFFQGIQHLCSELLEIKKASEQDLRANVYLSYLSFARMFHAAGDLDKHVHRLKRQVMAHRRLIQHLSSNCGGLDDEDGAGSGTKDEEPDIDMDDDADDGELELEVLLSEQRVEQALELVLRQRMVPQQGKARVAERLASVAGNPRTPRPELLRALSGLCKLGEAERANHLLFNWHRASVVQGSHDCYIKELARMVFSSIVQASRSFVALHGHPSPHTPQLLRWAREEMEDFSVAFSEYVRSAMSSSQQAGQSLALALEAAECAVSYSSLLRPLGIIAQDVGGLMAPCILEALAMYARHLKEVVRLLVASDDWVLGRFLMPPFAAAADEHRRYCMLTASGRKFVTLVGEVVDDVACPLRRVLGMDDPAAVQLVADLFGEYITHSIIPNPKNKQDHQHISVLINCTTLVSLLPTIGAWSASAQRQVGGLIKEAAGQVWSCFCQEFIRDTMAYSAPPQAQGQGQMMPSLPFQVVFLRVRRLKDAYGAILGGDDGTMKKLLKELLEEIISWLSTKPLDSWLGHGAQAQLDVHFLLEIARLGGFDITASALDLLRKAQQDKVEGDDGERPWAADAARHAVQVLLLHNMNSNGDAEEEEEENGNAAAVDAEEEFESESDGMASGKSAAGCDDGMASRKSSDEFISIEDDDGDRLTLGSDQAAPQNSANDDGVDDDSRRRRQATPLAAAEKDDAPRGRSRKKASSRPRWQ
ncbi:exocyst complex component EXO84A [Setaria viridis]|uniref:exocyst complex component EXO84A n=1 Tax=Setaria viridis TaxID=4556 RepID=UPI003B3B2CBF